MLPKRLLMVLIVQLPDQIPRLGRAANSDLSVLCPPLSSRTPKSGPQSQAPLGAQRPHSLAPRPIGLSWGTLPGDPANPPFARAKRGLLFPTGPRGSRPNPANYRPQGGGARARPPVSHGREESPSVRRGEQSCDSAAPARPPREPLGRPFPSLLLSRPATLLAGPPGLLPRLLLSLIPFLPACVCVSPASSLLPFLAVHSEALPVSVPCISPMARVQLACSPMGPSGGLSNPQALLSLFLGDPSDPAP